MSLTFKGLSDIQSLSVEGEDKENNGDDRESMFGRSLHQWHEAKLQKQILVFKKKRLDSEMSFLPVVFSISLILVKKGE